MQGGIGLKQMRPRIENDLLGSFIKLTAMLQSFLLLKHTYGEISTLHKYFLHMTWIKEAHETGKPPKIISPPIGSCCCNSLASDFIRPVLIAVAVCWRAERFSRLLVASLLDWVYLTPFPRRASVVNCFLGGALC